jgi:1-acyl-sn-glycerol-3-phosphate acyltransferase
VSEVFASSDRMILVIAPEGTRSAAPRWKSGFFEIAARARVPIVPAGVDARTKSILIGLPLEVGPDRGELMDRLRDFFEGMSGLRPHLQGPVRVIGEGHS